MSAAEIIKELPKLTEAERREVRRKLAELAAENEDSAANSEVSKQMEAVKDVMQRYRNTLRELAK
jgi:hypothetical protein